MARPHTLDQNPELVNELARLLAEGVSAKDIEKALDIAKATRIEWTRREDVRKAWTRIIRERANRVRSKTDTRIMAILESGADLSVKQLLEIRDSFSADVPEEGDAGAEVVTRLMKAAAKDPVLARSLRGALNDDNTGD